VHVLATISPPPAVSSHRTITGRRKIKTKLQWNRTPLLHDRRRLFYCVYFVFMTTILSPSQSRAIRIYSLNMYKAMPFISNYIYTSSVYLFATVTLFLLYIYILYSIRITSYRRLCIYIIYTNSDLVNARTHRRCGEHGT